MDTAIEIGTYLAVAGSGIVAGLFFTFSAFAMRAFASQPPSVGIRAMQAINVEILNPVFFILYLGTAVLSIALGLAALFDQPESGRWYLLAGGVCYLVAAIVITGAFNIPRNDRLASLDPDAPESVEVWNDYLTEWTMWNHVRTILSIAAIFAFTLSLTQ